MCFHYQTVFISCFAVITYLNFTYFILIYYLLYSFDAVECYYHFKHESVLFIVSSCLKIYFYKVLYLFGVFFVVFFVSLLSSLLYAI